jgi:universal stress protein A
MKHYQNILLAVNFSKLSETAAVRAVDLAKHYGADLTLLHVVEHFPEDLPVEEIPPENVDPKRYLTQVANRKLADFAKRVGIEQAEQEVVLSTSSAKHEIVRIAAQRNVDLIVVGSDGGHGIKGILGTTATGILNSTECDVLSVRKT